MRILVTGSTGFIGAALVRELVAKGYEVVCLYRNPEKIRKFPDAGVEAVRGDILDPASLAGACRGCERLFHLAAFTGVWSRNREMVRKLNAEGTRNVLEAALNAGIRDIVLTSTAGVTGPSSGTPVTEETVRSVPFFTPYEETKAEAEKIAADYVKKGLNIRIVNPTRLYGPGELNAGNSVTRIVKLYIEGKWRFITGDGNSTGNYVFIDDAVEGHILAMEKGKPGERYLLGGENISYNGFFNLLAEITGIRRKLIRLPVSAVLAAAGLSVAAAYITGTEPFITPGHVRRLNYNWIVSSEKAVRELGYSITPLREGLVKTVEWLKSANLSSSVF